ncbi:ribosomal maturation YjgA family protein [Paenibacillus agricola]|uniref:DUF2809 domain-containing protein n=1 Tax=Paenibacillus agricola TaxID=2716264 RepID=A0ABX0IX21_9BACL|nr:DUF2809 domain-containing protein [Paenibacillus agricola]NHN28253.1 DUF2809 domain-containing protein [Paenibacillus agricola]
MLKARSLYIFSIVTLILLGMGSRQFPEALPAFIVHHAGDVCWASMIYYVFRFIYLDKPRLFALLISMLFCSAIEFSQLYQAVWINDIRQTILGALILGKGFLTIDLIRYAVGLMIAVWIDYYGYKRIMNRT